MTALTRPLRYLLVSGLCMVLGTVLIPLFTTWGLHYALASAVAFIIVAFVGFHLHCAWTFGLKQTVVSFVRYLGGLVLNLPLSILLIGLTYDVGRLSIWTASLITSAILFIWNCLAVRWALLRKIDARAR